MFLRQFSKPNTFAMGYGVNCEMYHVQKGVYMYNLNNIYNKLLCIFYPD